MQPGGPVIQHHASSFAPLGVVLAKVGAMSWTDNNEGDRTEMSCSDAPDTKSSDPGMTEGGVLLDQLQLLCSPPELEPVSLRFLNISG